MAKRARPALAFLKCPLHGTPVCSFIGYCNSPRNKLTIAIDIHSPTPTHTHTNELKQKDGPSQCQNN